jgi:hypothetical protein
VVHVNGSPTPAAVEVGAGESFAAATFEKDAYPVDPGAAIDLYACSAVDLRPRPISLDGFMELES